MLAMVLFKVYVVGLRHVLLSVRTDLIFEHTKNNNVVFKLWFICNGVLVRILVIREGLYSVEIFY